MAHLNVWVSAALKAKIVALSPLLRPSAAAREGIEREIARLESEIGPEALANIVKAKRR